MIKNASLLIFVASCGLWFAACDFVKKDQPIIFLSITKQVQHPNKLSVGVPQGYAAQQTADGFQLAPEGDYDSQVRHPINISVALLENPPIIADSSFQTKELSGAAIRYRITPGDGGSGGEIYNFEAYRQIGTQQIKISQSLQAEHAEPDFAAAWSILQATQIISQ